MKPLIQDLLFLLLKVIIIAIMGVLLFTFLFGIIRNESPCMTPAIQDGDLIVYNRLDKQYVHSDVLVMEYEDRKMPFRVIGVAGDTIDIKEEGLSINGAIMQEPDIYEVTQRFEKGIDFPITVGSGEVFVLGDSRENATDSRIFGSVKLTETKGKVMTVIRRRGI